MYAAIVDGWQSAECGVSVGMHVCMGVCACVCKPVYMWVWTCSMYESIQVCMCRIMSVNLCVLVCEHAFMWVCLLCFVRVCLLMYGNSCVHIVHWTWRGCEYMPCLAEEHVICPFCICVCTCTPWESKWMAVKAGFFFNSLLEATLHGLSPSSSSIALFSCLLKFHMLTSLSHVPRCSHPFELGPPCDCLQGSTEGLCLIS